MTIEPSIVCICDLCHGKQHGLSEGHPSRWKGFKDRNGDERHLCGACYKIVKSMCGHDHTASMEDADDRPQHTMGKEVDAATLLTCNTCTGTGHPDGNWLQLNITIGGRDRSSLVCPRCQAFIVEAIKKKDKP